MSSPLTDASRFNSRSQVYAVLGALVVSASISLLQSDASLFLFLVISIILSVSILFLLIYAAFGKNRRRSSYQLLTLAIFWTISTSFLAFEFSHPIAIRSVARWLAWSRDYKTQVLTQPQSPNGELKHIDWDGWGMFAQNTEVYLVYDPTDSLWRAALSGERGKFDGIPCKVQLVRRLESHWYSVIFYTSETWDYCN